MNIQNKNKNKTKRVFKKKDYYSGDGMLTAVWGPSMWHYLHIMSFNYPVKPTDEDKKYYKEFVLNLQHVLPCKYCRQNLTNNLKSNPLTMTTMKDRDSFSRYIYKLHERYEHFRSRCTDEKPKVFNIKKTQKNKNKNKKEKGCTEPLYGKKSKCIIKIVPQEEKCKTLQIDKKCIKTRDA